MHFCQQQDVLFSLDQQHERSLENPKSSIFLEAIQHYNKQRVCWRFLEQSQDSDRLQVSADPSEQRQDPPQNWRHSGFPHRH